MYAAMYDVEAPGMGFRRFELFVTNSPRHLQLQRQSLDDYCSISSIQLVGVKPLLPETNPRDYLNAIARRYQGTIMNLFGPNAGDHPCTGDYVCFAMEQRENGHRVIERESFERI